MIFQSCRVGTAQHNREPPPLLSFVIHHSQFGLVGWALPTTTAVPSFARPRETPANTQDPAIRNPKSVIPRSLFWSFGVSTFWRFPTAREACPFRALGPLTPRPLDPLIPRSLGPSSWHSPSSSRASAEHNSLVERPLRASGRREKKFREFSLIQHHIFFDDACQCPRIPHSAFPLPLPP